MQHPNTPATSERSYPLDFLKILATIIIVFHHFQQTTGITYEGTVNFYYGKFYFGYVVELFFILSGFFMLRYIKKIQSGLSFQEFYLKRAFRLLPLVACSAIVYEVLLEVYHFLYRTSWFDVEVTLFGVLTTSLGIQSGWAFSNPSVNNPVWYISVLLLCYAVFYLLTRFHGKIPVVYLYLAMIFLGCGICTYGINLPFLNASSARGYYSFFTGVLLALALDHWKITAKGVCLCLFNIVLIVGLIIVKYAYVERDLVFLLTFVLYPSIIVVFQTDFVKKLFSHPFWGLWGKISYDVFIWHNPMYLAMYIVMKLFSWEIDFTHISSMYIYCLIAEIVGVLSYYFLEQPINRFVKKHFEKKTAAS